MLEIHQFPCLSDNYGFLLHDPESGETVCIDTPDAETYLREAKAKGWRITQIWNTHWHPDHAGGNAAIKLATGCCVVAPLVDAPKIAKYKPITKPMLFADYGVNTLGTGMFATKTTLAKDPDMIR